MGIISGIIVSSISGLYSSSWGAYKDSPYEGLKIYTFPRSVIFSIAIFLILLSIPINRAKCLAPTLAKLFFLIMGIERVNAEAYKGFFRNECQKKYFVPSRIMFLGRHIKDSHRYGAGIVLFMCALAILFLEIKVENYFEFLMVSVCAGITTAAGGAYKDAPYEGFEPAKFIRSPIILAINSPLFYFLGPVSLGGLLYMNWGLERFIIEYYKTFIQRTRSGKFRPDIQKTQRFDNARQGFHKLALLIIFGVICLFIYEVYTY